MIITKNLEGIKVQGIRKLFGNKNVLNNISFEVNQGSILALLGPNGAGKTTTINILSTLLIADGGTATVAGYDINKEDDKVRGSIGLTGQFAAVDEYLTGRENLVLVGRLYHMRGNFEQRAQDLLEQFDLVDMADKPTRTYSGGMKRRLDLAMSLIASPSVIFLDEPTTGLDPRSRLSLWSMIKDLAKEGKTILLTTQYMEEAEQLAKDIVVIDNGAVIANGTPTELKNKVGSQRIEVIFLSQPDTIKAARLFDRNVVTLDEESSKLGVSAEQGLASLKDTIQRLEHANLNVASIALRQPTLDDVFLALTGHDATDKSGSGVDKNVN